MMKFSLMCDTCKMNAKCSIKSKLVELSSTAPYNKLEHDVMVFCKLYHPSPAGTVTGCYCSGGTFERHLQFVNDCDSSCSFRKYCSAPIDFKVFSDFVIHAVDIHELPLQFQSMCACKIEEDVKSE